MNSTLIQKDKSIPVSLENVSPESITEYQSAVIAYFHPYGSGEPTRYTSRIQSKKKIQEYLDITAFQNILEMDYGPALRMVGAHFLSRQKQGILLAELPHISLVFLILIGIRLQKNQRFIPEAKDPLLSLDIMLGEALRNGGNKLDQVNLVASLQVLNVYLNEVSKILK